MLSKIYVILLIALANTYGQTLPVINPAQAGFNEEHLAQVDQIIESSIEKGVIPGAVLLVTRNDKIVYQKAYGYRQLIPNKERMAVNTIFDLASITKPIATATSVMILIDRGQLTLLDRVSDFIPEFKPWPDPSGADFEPIRLIHLLTHTSGLPPYAPVKELEERYGSPAVDSLIHHIATVPRHHAPGTYFQYSCLNFITLQRIIEISTGQGLKDFAQENIFSVLGMEHTTFQPGQDFIEHCAPTEFLDQKELLKGKVHDPLARIMMGGVSGNAGLFSTADDLALFASMMLNHGEFNHRRILSPAAVTTMTQIPHGYENFGRALGWDLHSDYSSNRGDLFGEEAYGHTGYTGTSMVIDPQSKTVVILLTNRVHPHDRGSVVRLRSLVSNIVAGAIIKD